MQRACRTGQRLGPPATASMRHRRRGLLTHLLEPAQVVGGVQHHEGVNGPHLAALHDLHARRPRLHDYATATSTPSTSNSASRRVTARSAAASTSGLLALGILAVATVQLRPYRSSKMWRREAGARSSGRRSSAHVHVHAQPHLHTPTPPSPHPHPHPHAPPPKQCKDAVGGRGGQAGSAQPRTVQSHPAPHPPAARQRPLYRHTAAAAAAAGCSARTTQAPWSAASVGGDSCMAGTRKRRAGVEAAVAHRSSRARAVGTTPMHLCSSSCSRSRRTATRSCGRSPTPSTCSAIRRQPAATAVRVCVAASEPAQRPVSGGGPVTHLPL